MDELIKKLDKLGKMKPVHAAMKGAAVHVKGMMTVYPAKTIANSPGNPRGQWYERGWGVRYKGGGGRQTSERLDSSWSFKYDASRTEATIGTNVSYAKYVQGPKGTQAKALQRIGWKGVDVVAAAETKRVQEYIFAAVMRAVKA